MWVKGVFNAHAVADHAKVDASFAVKSEHCHHATMSSFFGKDQHSHNHHTTSFADAKPSASKGGASDKEAAGGWNPFGAAKPAKGGKK